MLENSNRQWLFFVMPPQPEGHKGKAKPDDRPAKAKRHPNLQHAENRGRRRPSKLKFQRVAGPTLSASPTLPM